MPEPHATPRRFPRVKLLGNVTGEVSFLQDVTLLDLSEGGLRGARRGDFLSTQSASSVYVYRPLGGKPRLSTSVDRRSPYSKVSDTP
jgi:hypothetical protein